jgi:hypothetical protein
LKLLTRYPWRVAGRPDLLDQNSASFCLFILPVAADFGCRSEPTCRGDGGKYRVSPRTARMAAILGLRYFPFCMRHARMIRAPLTVGCTFFLARSVVVSEIAPARKSSGYVSADAVVIYSGFTVDGPNHGSIGTVHISQGPQ